MVVGNWGETITFEVSDEKIMTFSNFQRNVSGRWKDHDIVNEKPRSEFAGPSLSDVSLTVSLSSEHGVKPRYVIEQLEKAVEGGEVNYLFVGGRRIGDYMMKLESISETWDTVVFDGVLMKATLSLSFSEYIQSADPSYSTLSGFTKIPWEYIVGDEVEFIGTTAVSGDGNANSVAGYEKLNETGAFYYKSQKNPKKIKYNKKGYRTDIVLSVPSPAKVTKYKEGAAHPWYLKATDKTKAPKGRKKVAGWVDDGWFK